MPNRFQVFKEEAERELGARAKRLAVLEKMIEKAKLREALVKDLLYLFGRKEYAVLVAPKKSKGKKHDKTQESEGYANQIINLLVRYGENEEVCEQILAELNEAADNFWRGLDRTPERFSKVFKEIREDLIRRIRSMPSREGSRPETPEQSSAPPDGASTPVGTGVPGSAQLISEERRGSDTAGVLGQEASSHTISAVEQGQEESTADSSVPPSPTEPLTEAAEQSGPVSHETVQSALPEPGAGRGGAAGGAGIPAPEESGTAAQPKPKTWQAWLEENGVRKESILHSVLIAAGDEGERYGKQIVELLQKITEPKGREQLVLDLNEAAHSHREHRIPLEETLGERIKQTQESKIRKRQLGERGELGNLIDVPDKGNCFYYAIADQLLRIDTSEARQCVNVLKEGLIDERVNQVAEIIRREAGPLVEGVNLNDEWLNAKVIEIKQLIATLLDDVIKEMIIETRRRVRVLRAEDEAAGPGDEVHKIAADMVILAYMQQQLRRKIAPNSTDPDSKDREDAEAARTFPKLLSGFLKGFRLFYIPAGSSAAARFIDVTPPPPSTGGAASASSSAVPSADVAVDPKGNCLFIAATGDHFLSVSSYRGDVKVPSFDRFAWVSRVEPPSGSADRTIHAAGGAAGGGGGDSGAAEAGAPSSPVVPVGGAVSATAVTPAPFVIADYEAELHALHAARREFNAALDQFRRVISNRREVLTNDQEFCERKIKDLEKAAKIFVGVDAASLGASSEPLRTVISNKRSTGQELVAELIDQLSPYVSSAAASPQPGTQPAATLGRRMAGRRPVQISDHSSRGESSSPGAAMLSGGSAGSRDSSSPSSDESEKRALLLGRSSPEDTGRTGSTLRPKHLEAIQNIQSSFNALLEAQAALLREKGVVSSDSGAAAPASPDYSLAAVARLVAPTPERWFVDFFTNPHNETLLSWMQGIANRFSERLQDQTNFQFVDSNDSAKTIQRLLGFERVESPGFTPDVPGVDGAPNPETITIEQLNSVGQEFACACELLQRFIDLPEVEPVKDRLQKALESYKQKIDLMGSTQARLRRLLGDPPDYAKLTMGDQEFRQAVRELLQNLRDQLPHNADWDNQMGDLLSVCRVPTFKSSVTRDYPAEEAEGRYNALFGVEKTNLVEGFPDEQKTHGILPTLLFQLRQSQDRLLQAQKAFADSALGVDPSRASAPNFENMVKALQEEAPGFTRLKTVLGLRDELAPNVPQTRNALRANIQQATDPDLEKNPLRYLSAYRKQLADNIKKQYDFLKAVGLSESEANARIKPLQAVIDKMDVVISTAKCREAARLPRETVLGQLPTAARIFSLKREMDEAMEAQRAWFKEVPFTMSRNRGVLILDRMRGLASAGVDANDCVEDIISALTGLHTEMKLIVFGKGPPEASPSPTFTPGLVHAQHWFVTGKRPKRQQTGVSVDHEHFDLLKDPPSPGRKGEATTESKRNYSYLIEHYAVEPWTAIERAIYSLGAGYTTPRVYDYILNACRDRFGGLDTAIKDVASLAVHPKAGPLTPGALFAEPKERQGASDDLYAQMRQASMEFESRMHGVRRLLLLLDPPSSFVIQLKQLLDGFNLFQLANYWQYSGEKGHKKLLLAAEAQYQKLEALTEAIVKHASDVNNVKVADTTPDGFPTRGLTHPQLVAALTYACHQLRVAGHEYAEAQRRLTTESEVAYKSVFRMMHPELGRFPLASVERVLKDPAASPELKAVCEQRRQEIHRLDAINAQKAEGLDPDLVRSMITETQFARIEKAIQAGVAKI